MIALEQARELVVLLEAGEQQKADEFLFKISNYLHEPLYLGVGKITRQLHDSLNDFRLNPRVGKLANDEIPHAKDRLNFVIEKTEFAANRTIDAVDVSCSIASKLQSNLFKITSQWHELMKGKIDIHDFKILCHDLDGLISELGKDVGALQQQLTEILMAQDFQDLTGQVIRHVIDVVHEVENQLIDILSAFGSELNDEFNQAATLNENVLCVAEGPVLTEEKRKEKHVMESQNDVDDLLTSLGF